MDARDLVVHAAFLRRLAGSLLVDDHLAQDAAQEAFAAALHRHDVRDLRAWLAGVTRNVSLRMLRGAAGRRRAEQAAARTEALPSAEALAANAEAQHRVAKAVLQLDEPYRSTVLLRFFHQLTPSEIARRQGEPVATVKTRLRRALAALRARLDETHGGDRRAWSVALLPLVAHRPPAAGVLGGIVLMKTKILAVATVLALLAAVLSMRPWETRGGGGATRSRTAASELPGATEHAPPEAAAVRTDVTDAGLTTGAETVSARERELYREWRCVLPVFAESRRTTREAHALLEQLGAAKEERPPVGDPTTAAYLQDLARAYRTAAPGADRLDVLRKFVETHAKYLEATHDTSFLPFLDGVIRGSDVDQERELAVPDADERTLPLLLRLADHVDPAVRAAVVRALAGSEDSRAVDIVVRGLEDGAPAVRWTAALELEFTVADAAHVDALLKRLPHETHPLAADGMVRAVLALDPEGGARRVEGAVAAAPDTVRGVVLTALRSPEPTEIVTEPRSTAENQPAPDAVTSAYLQRLLQEYRALEGAERLKALEKLANAHAGYLERSGDASLLPVLAEIARGAPDVRERVAVVSSFSQARDRRVVDLLIELKGSPEAPVRSAVASALMWVRGTEAHRARSELLDLLADRAASVRIAVASLLSVGDAANVPRLLEALRDETDVFAAYAMIEAVLRLAPGTHIESRGRPVIEEALRLRNERK